MSTSQQNLSSTQEVAKYFSAFVKQISQKVFAEPFGELAKFLDSFQELALNAKKVEA